MKLVSFNINGIRAILGKGFPDAFASFDADVFFIINLHFPRSVPKKIKTPCKNLAGRNAFYEHILYHPDFNRRLRSFTASVAKELFASRGL